MWDGEYIQQFHDNILQLVIAILATHDGFGPSVRDDLDLWK